MNNTNSLLKVILSSGGRGISGLFCFNIIYTAVFVFAVALYTSSDCYAAPPVLDPIANITVSEGETVVITPTATDPDEDILSYSYSGWMLSDTYTTSYNDAGEYTVTVTVTDGTSTDSQDVTVTVEFLNIGLELDHISNITVNEGEVVSFSPTSTAGDGNVLTYIYSGWMLSNTYSTNYRDAGIHTVRVIVTDGLMVDSQDVTVTVLDLNVAPVLNTIADMTVNEGEIIAFSPTATDAGGDTLTYIYTGWMTSNTFTTSSGDIGTHTVTVTVSDGTLTDTQDVTVTVNVAPVLDPISNITVNEGEVVSFSPTASDTNGDTLIYSYSGWMSSDTYTTNYRDAGDYTVTVTVSDGVLTDSQNVAVTVVDLDVAPVL
ncbi:MAG: hypothetical protein GY775_01000, partial [Candidatus Scalindua sp.]|nr:hypothetical protein [Candidatus Scalindua sp.]